MNVSCTRQQESIRNWGTFCVSDTWDQRNPGSINWSRMDATTCKESCALSKLGEIKERPRQSFESIFAGMQGGINPEALINLILLRKRNGKS